MSEEPAGPDPEPTPSGDTDQAGPAPRPPEGEPDSPPPREPGGGEQDPGRPPLDERARALGPGAGRQDEGPEVAAGTEKRLDGASENVRSQERRLRDDVPRASFTFDGETTVGNIAGRDAHTYYTTYNFTAGGRAGARGSVIVSQLARMALVHVRTDTDAVLLGSFRTDRVVILRGRLESGRRSSAISVLDELTGTVREQSLISDVEAAPGWAAWPGGWPRATGTCWTRPAGTGWTRSARPSSARSGAP